MRGALAALPSAHANILVMSYFHRMGIAQIADRVTLTRAEVVRLLSEALRLLTTALDALDVDPDAVVHRPAATP